MVEYWKTWTRDSSTKMGADSLAENIPNAPNDFGPICLTKPKSFGLQVRDGDFIEFEFKQIKVLTNKFGLFVSILVCLTKVLPNNFGLFVRILVCLSVFWFVCQHFGLFASILVNQIADKQTKMPTNHTI